MARWSLEFQPAAEKDLAKLSKSVRARVLDKLEWLEEHFDSAVLLPLGSEFKGFFKVRIGDWRAIYRLDWEKRLIVMCYIDHRSKIYKQ